MSAGAAFSKKLRSFFICWITFHFEEFQSLAINKKIPKTSKMYVVTMYLCKYDASFKEIPDIKYDLVCNYNHYIELLVSIIHTYYSE